MEGDIEKVRAAAERFVNGFVREKDRVTVMSFDTRAQNRIGFTNDREDLIRALAGLEATGSTALYDAAIYALSYFDGITSQRALLLLSDGEDESSLFDFDRTVEVARRSGVAVFAIGLGEAAEDRDSRKVLRTLAEETGGRAFFIDTVDELDRIYTEIDEECEDSDGDGHGNDGWGSAGPTPLDPPEGLTFADDGAFHYMNEVDPKDDATRDNVLVNPASGSLTFTFCP